MNTRVEEAEKTWDLYSSKQRWSFLIVLFLIGTSNIVDRQIVSVLLEPLKDEFNVSDTALGLLTGLSFALLYVTLGLPIARLADQHNRKLIIGICLTVWSVMTALCGAAQSFLQLALARVGVGAGEAGSIPASQSLIADYFPPKNRSMGLAIFFLSAVAGNVLGVIVGGQVAEAFGWRWTFVIFGLPGLLLVILVYFVLDEPRTLDRFKIKPEQSESVRDTLSILKKKPSFVNTVIGMVLFYAMLYGVLTFSVSFLIRTYNLTLSDASIYYGLIGLVSAVIGNPLGGWMTDKLGQRTPKWFAWIPGCGFLLALPLLLSAFLSSSLMATLAFLVVSMLIMMTATPPIYSCIHAVCGNKRRATAVAIALFFANLFGTGLGPLATGLLSDFFAQSFGEADGLKFALASMTLLYIPSAWFMLRAAKTMEQDAEI